MQKFEIHDYIQVGDICSKVLLMAGHAWWSYLNAEIVYITDKEIVINCSEKCYILDKDLIAEYCFREGTRGDEVLRRIPENTYVGVDPRPANTQMKSGSASEIIQQIKEGDTFRFWRDIQENNKVGK